MNVRKRIWPFFLAAVPMVLPLFSESAFVEIQKVPSNYLIRVRSCKFPLLIVFSQPGLSNKNRPVFTFYRYLDRSEERRVGKECRSRGSPYHLKKKKIKMRNNQNRKRYMCDVKCD